MKKFVLLLASVSVLGACTDKDDKDKKSTKASTACVPNVISDGKYVSETETSGLLPNNTVTVSYSSKDITLLAVTKYFSMDGKLLHESIYTPKEGDEVTETPIEGEEDYKIVFDFQRNIVTEDEMQVGFDQAASKGSAYGSIVYKYDDVSMKKINTDVDDSEDSDTKKDPEMAEYATETCSVESANITFEFNEEKTKMTSTLLLRERQMFGKKAIENIGKNGGPVDEASVTPTPSPSPSPAPAAKSSATK